MSFNINVRVIYTKRGLEPIIEPSDLPPTGEIDIELNFVGLAEKYRVFYLVGGEEVERFKKYRKTIKGNKIVLKDYYFGHKHVFIIR